VLANRRRWCKDVTNLDQAEDPYPLGLRLFQASNGKTNLAGKERNQVKRVLFPIIGATVLLMCAATTTTNAADKLVVPVYKMPGTDKLVVPVYKMPGTDKLVVHVYKMPG
jgi:hypothetical protein